MRWWKKQIDIMAEGQAFELGEQVRWADSDEWRVIGIGTEEGRTKLEIAAITPAAKASVWSTSVEKVT